jgi:ABC-type spermidine/putrescine transport system permease subunit II
VRRPPVVLWTVTALVGVFLFTPIVVVVLYSLNSRNSLAAFGSPSLRWYESVFHNSTVLASIEASGEVAAAAMVVATVIGTVLAIGLGRGGRRLASVPSSLILLALCMPEIATAVSLFILYTTLHIQLSLLTVALAHITWAVVYVTVVVRARLAALPAEVEDAAADLGATPAAATWLVIVPQLLPAIIGAALLVFVLSFDDFVTSFFTVGVGVQPLPLLIYSMLKFGVSPEINAIGTMMMIVSLLVGASGYALVTLRSNRRAGEVVEAGKA